jgi:hypothetical protein
MQIRYYTSSLIFFAYWDRRPKTPACRQAGKTETPKYQFVANYILVFFAYWQSSG